MPPVLVLYRAAVDYPWDALALIVFGICWLGYEPFLRMISKKSGLITKDLSVVRMAWMKEATQRGLKLFDSNLIGHAVNSASNFSSANLLLIAAVAGVLFSGHLPFSAVKSLGFDVPTQLLFQLKLALVVVCLTRGLLNFIWALRQMNYCAAALGSLPEAMDEASSAQYADALSDILEPAMSNFSQGVRGYYFSLASAAWLFGPEALIIASLGAIVLLGWRQSRSQAARGLRRLRELLETHPERMQAIAAAQNSDKNIAAHNQENRL